MPLHGLAVGNQRPLADDGLASDLGCTYEGATSPRSYAGLVGLARQATTEVGVDEFRARRGVLIAHAGMVARPTATAAITSLPRRSGLRDMAIIDLNVTRHMQRQIHPMCEELRGGLAPRRIRSTNPPRTFGKRTVRSGQKIGRTSSATSSFRAASSSRTEARAGNGDKVPQRTPGESYSPLTRTKRRSRLLTDESFNTRKYTRVTIIIGDLNC